MPDDIVSPFIPSWRSPKDDRTRSEGVQIHPQTAIFRSQSRSKIQSLIAGAGAVVVLFAVIAGANMFIARQSRYDVSATVAGTQMVYGMVGSIDYQGSSFSLLFERSADPAIAGSGLFRFQAVVPDQAITRGGLNRSLPVCSTVETFDDLTKAKPAHCSEVVREGSHILVVFTGFDRDRQTLAVKAVVGLR